MTTGPGPDNTAPRTSSSECPSSLIKSHRERAHKGAQLIPDIHVAICKRGESQQVAVAWTNVVEQAGPDNGAP